jgi:hypothetical protein
MIYIKDDFLDINLIDLLRTNKDEFQEIKTLENPFGLRKSLPNYANYKI